MKIHRSLILCSLSLALLLCGVLLHEKTDAPTALPTDTTPQSTSTPPAKEETEEEKHVIKYIDFTPTKDALSDALAAHLSARDSGKECPFVDLLALLATRYGGDFSSYRKKDLADYAEKLSAGMSPEDCVQNDKLLAYYKEAYSAVLSGMVGEYTEVKISEGGNETAEMRYGLRAFSPIAAGYSYSDYDDFGAGRSYGYKRSHLGHDMLGSVGTPIIAVESGTVTSLGWNQYGGWRIGITSFDGLRYYYYAHLRRGHPYCDLYEGKIVHAGEVIGYLGMTGYSAKEDVNNINVPHLHIGLQIIFEPEQKDGWNQIWVDMYALTDFLSQNRARTTYLENTKEHISRRYDVFAETPD